MRIVTRRRLEDDSYLVQQAQAGNLPAFENLIRLHARAAARLSARLLGNREDAEDVVQEAFTKAYQNLGAFRGDAAFRTWLLHITLNVAQDHLRQRQRREKALRGMDPITDQMSGTTSGPLATASARDEAQALALALDDLPPRQKTALLLKIYEGYSHKEVAQVLGTTEGATRVYLALARQSLRRRFGKQPPGKNTAPDEHGGDE